MQSDELGRYLVGLYLPHGSAAVQTHGEVGHGEQLPHDEVAEAQFGEGGLPARVRGDDRALADVDAEHQVVLNVLQDQVVAHHLKAGDHTVR